jgi:hypothetical protein
MKDTSISHIDSEVKSDSNTKTELTPQSSFQITIGINSTQIDNEFVLVDLLSNKSFRFNFTGSFIWSLIAKNVSLEEIENAFSSEYNLSSEEAHEYIIRFIKNLIHSGLIALQ